MIRRLVDWRKRLSARKKSFTGDPAYIDKTMLLTNHYFMSFFDKKCPCGAPQWQVDGFLFLFWLAGSIGIPLVLGADHTISARWLLTPAIIVISLLLYRRESINAFFIGSFASVFLVLIGIAAKALIGHF
jgi:hypothetical protein